MDQICWTRLAASQSVQHRLETRLAPDSGDIRGSIAGSFCQEKEDAVAWHFRMADPEQAELRAPELVDHMTHLTAKTDLQVVLGSKVVEIRRAGVDKGTAALNWLNDGDYDFIIGIGDDTTDEDLFKNMPASALTIRVGIAPTLHAMRYRAALK